MRGIQNMFHSLETFYSGSFRMYVWSNKILETEIKERRKTERNLPSMKLEHWSKRQKVKQTKEEERKTGIA